MCIVYICVCMIFKKRKYFITPFSLNRGDQKKTAGGRGQRRYDDEIGKCRDWMQQIGVGEGDGEGEFSPFGHSQSIIVC